MFLPNSLVRDSEIPPGHCHLTAGAWHRAELAAHGYAQLTTGDILQLKLEIEYLCDELRKAHGVIDTLQLQLFAVELGMR